MHVVLCVCDGVLCVCGFMWGVGGALYCVCVVCVYGVCVHVVL